MLISMIAAMAKGRVIGRDNQMPWHLPADLRHFKQVTMGKPVIMGRKTYESIGKALPGRVNIVISRDPDFKLYDASVVNSIDAALSVAGDVDEVMVIGGGAIYSGFMSRCQRLYLTFIDAEVAGDTCFPDYSAEAHWRSTEIGRHPADERNPYNLEFVQLDRQ